MIPLLPGRTGLHRLDCLSSNGLMDNCCRSSGTLRESYRRGTPSAASLVTGRDLMALGFSPGPDFQKWLSHIRELQLERHAAEQEGGLAAAGAQVAPVDQNTLRYPGKLAYKRTPFLRKERGHRLSPSFFRKRGCIKSFQFMRPVIYQLFVATFPTWKCTVDWEVGEKTAAAHLTG